MDEQQVRALVRQAIDRHLGPPGAPSGPVSAAPPPRPHGVAAPSLGRPDGDISHARFHLVRPPGEVECLIEPAVPCNHCGFCQCYGH